MKYIFIFLTLFGASYAHYKGPLPLHPRFKRDAVGALDILTNNAQPIHAEVKQEGEASTTTETSSHAPIHAEVKAEVNEVEITTKKSPELHGEVKATSSSPTGTTREKPCPKPYVPSPIEMGTVFQVIPPKDVSTLQANNTSVEILSLSGRKSWPLSSRLDWIKSITRTFTFGVLLVSAAIEFYPLLLHLFTLAHS